MKARKMKGDCDEKLKQAKINKENSGLIKSK